MTGASVVAVDVGNSTVGLAIQIGGEFVPHFVSLEDDNWTRRCVQWVRQQLDGQEVIWLVASVRSSAADRLIQHLSASMGDSAHRVTRDDVPMGVTVKSPDRLGIDRLLAAHAATKILPSPLAVVDVGSAITIDWVDERGRFCGGAILPGLSLQAEALHRWTESLPNLSAEMDREDAIRLPGRNTSEAIRGGILAGAAGAVDAIVSRYAGSTPRPSIALTGGQAALIAPLLEQNHRLLPNLVCRGLLELPRSKQYGEPESEVH